ncbi:MAG: coiled coil domain-containing protein [Desulfuromonas sp.]|nr:MAG: coiled coil domain-containing protein [Desulfuromonas sp.]
MDKKKSYEERLEAELNEWSAKIDVLKAKAAKTKSDAEINFAEEIERLEAKKAGAKAKLQQLREAGDDAWDDLKAGIEKAWSDLGSAISAATARFK